MEESASIFWAREMRGTMSMAITFAPVPLACSSRSLSLRGIEEGNERLAGREFGNLVSQRRAHLGDDVGLRIERIRRVDHTHAGGAIEIVRKAGELARAAFDHALISEFLQLGGAVRRHRDARLSLKPFPANQSASLSSCLRQRIL